MPKLVSLAEVKEMLSIKTVTKDYDSLINNRLIPGVGDRFEQFLGRELEDTGTDRVEFFDSDGMRRSLPLKRYPINQDLTAGGIVLVVNEDATRQYPANTDLDSDEIVVRDPEGVVYKDTLFPPFFAGSKSIRVTYRGGFKSEGGVLCVPESMKLAALMQISHIWRRRNSLGAEATDIGAGSLSWMKEISLLKDVREALEYFKRIR